MRGSVMLLLLLLLTSTIAVGQREIPQLGTRVRATTSGPARAPHIGVIAGQLGDTLLIVGESSDTMRVPLASLDVLEVSEGEHGHTLQGALWGTLIGGVAGALIVSQNQWLPEEAGSGAGLGAVAGGLGGLLIGTVVGSAIRSERWNSAPGWNMGLSIRF